MRLLGKKSVTPAIESCTHLVKTGKDLLSEHEKLRSAVYATAELACSDEVRALRTEEADRIADGLKAEIENIYHQGGCQIEFQVGQEAVRAACVARECPFYPNGPNHIS